jgi:uncharacterized membrane protein YeiB
VKDFIVYTSLRILLFIVCYAVLAGLWVAVRGSDTEAFIWPFVGAVVASSLLSLRFLRGPRERLARSVEARASRATARFDQIKSREDADQDA